MTEGAEGVRLRLSTMNTLPTHIADAWLVVFFILSTGMTTQPAQNTRRLLRKASLLQSYQSVSLCMGVLSSDLIGDDGGHAAGWNEQQQRARGSVAPFCSGLIQEKKAQKG